MKFLQHASDGGKDSGVSGFFFVEIKPLFSIVLLCFKSGTREAFHSHAFNALTWFIKGTVQEHRINPDNPSEVTVKTFGPSLKPKYTPRANHHKVYSVGETYALSIRGPWVNTWREFLPSLGKFVTLTHGRKVVDSDIAEYVKAAQVIQAVSKEVGRSSALFPPPANPHEALGIIQEEFDEFKAEVYRYNLAKGRDTRPAMREELVQLAAMAVRAAVMAEGVSL